MAEDDSRARLAAFSLALGSSDTPSSLLIPSIIAIALRLTLLLLLRISLSVSKEICSQDSEGYESSRAGYRGWWHRCTLLASQLKTLKACSESR